jgi:arylsulfatase A-like enzyme
MQSLDDNVGKVLQALQHLGLEQNTMVIFANDNGGQAGQNGASNIPLRGVKGTVLEGGLKTPMTIRWPEHLPPGEIYDQPISTLDIFPTVAHAIGAPLLVDRVYDGVDLMPYISDGSTDLPHQTLYWRVNWASAVRHHNWKLIRTPGNQTWLFDLGKDPGESYNLLEQHSSIAELLGQKLDQWEAQLIKPLWIPDPMWKKSAQQHY